MELITNLFSMDFAALVPELQVFLKIVHTLLTLAVLAGPIALLVLGALYLFKPAPEANFRYGYRTYYGMGSIEAWQFSQRIAGLVYGALGAVLLIVMFIVVLILSGKELLQIAKTSAICLLGQAILLLLARLGIGIWAGIYFDGNGERRR